METSSTEAIKVQVADHIVQYANKHGMWPTIDFIVKRWIEKNPAEFESLKSAIVDAKTNLQNRFGNNESTRKGNMPMKRTLELPEKIWTLINVLFTVQKKEYKGGEKGFWRDFANKYPAFKIGD